MVKDLKIVGPTIRGEIDQSNLEYDYNHQPKTQVFRCRRLNLLKVLVLLKGALSNIVECAALTATVSSILFFEAAPEACEERWEGHSNDENAGADLSRSCLSPAPPGSSL